MEIKDRDECVVSGVLVMLLRVTRCAGLAPVHIHHLRNGSYRIKYHRTIHVIASMTLTVSHVIMLYFMFKENVVPYLLRRINKSTLWALLNSVNQLCVLAILSIGVYGAQRRMKIFMNVVHQIQEVNTYIQNPNSAQPRKWKLWLGVFSIMGIINGLLILDHFCNTENCLISISYLYMRCLLLIAELQFVYFNIVTYLLTKTVNNAIRELYADDTEIKLLPVFSITQNSKKTEVINGLIKDYVVEDNDVIKTDDLSILGIPLQTSRAASTRLKKLAHSYLVICNVVYQVYKSEGGMMLLLICYQVIGIFLVLFVLISKRESPYDNVIWSCITQCTWLTLHIIQIIILIEPSYYLQQEMGKTKVVLSQLINLPISNSLRKELDGFFLQFLMRQPACAPMGICTFNRSFIATIAAVVTSLLIVMMQFHLKGYTQI